MGTFMKKDELLAEAERLGVDIEGLTWPQQQKAVIDAKTAAGENVQYGSTLKKEDKNPEPTEPIVVVHEGGKATPNMYEELYGKSVLISPEIKPTLYQNLKYDEVLDEEIEVEEKSFHDEFELGHDVLASKELTTGTYRIKGKTGRKVVAQASIPKENARIEFVVGAPVPYVMWNNRVGYLWTHHRLPNVKDLLLQSGNYEKYKDMFKDEPWIWYAAGILACDINRVDTVLREIEEETARRRESR